MEGKLKDLKCMLTFHKYEIYKEEELKNIRGEVIGKIIVCRCTNCGKIKSYEVITNKDY